MSRFGRIMVGVVVGTMLVAGTASASAPAKKKKVSTEKYAKVVCTNYQATTDAIEEFIQTYNGNTSDDPVTFQGEIVTLTNDLIADIEALTTKLAKSYPDVDDGKSIAKTFVGGLESTNSEISDGLAEFQAADATGVAFQADVTSFELTFNLLDVNRSDPFSEISDQDLLGAFDDEKACKDVVTIYGA